MVKKYRRLTDEERKNLVILIHRDGYTIKDASRKLNIPYPNAKAVNQTFILENRTAKKNFRYRINCSNFGGTSISNPGRSFHSGSGGGVMP